MSRLARLQQLGGVRGRGVKGWGGSGIQEVQLCPAGRWDCVLVRSSGDLGEALEGPPPRPLRPRGPSCAVLEADSPGVAKLQPSRHFRPARTSQMELLLRLPAAEGG